MFLSGSAKVLAKLSVRGILLILIGRQGPIALAVDADGGCQFSVIYLSSFLSPSLGDGPI